MVVPRGAWCQWPVDGRPGLVGRDGDAVTVGCTDVDGLTVGVAEAETDGDGLGSGVGAPQMLSSAETTSSPPEISTV